MARKGQYLKLKEKGICVRCRNTPAEVNRVQCKSCATLSQQITKNSQINRQKNGLCRCCGLILDTTINLCSSCRTVHNTANRRLHEQRKITIIKEYGGCCACCGETEIEFLQIDHVNNDGAAHRKLTNNNVYDWLKRNNYPKGNFQLLCANCNFSKRLSGICIHKKVIKTLEAHAS